MAMVITNPRLPDNPIVAHNQAFRDLTGYDADEIDGRNCRFLQGPDSNPEMVKALGAAVRAERVEKVELLNYRKDGSAFWNNVHVSPIYDDDGHLIFYYGSQWDVTERFDTIDALDGKLHLPPGLLQSKIDQIRLLSAAVSGSKEGVLLTEYGPIDEPGPRIVWANEGFEQLFGYSMAEVLGNSPRMFQGPETDRAVLDRIRAGLESGDGVTDVRAVNYHKDGSKFWMEWSISPVRDACGRPTHWLAIQRDVTEKVEAREQLEMLSGELAHRYKNQLTVISALQRLIPTEGRSADDYKAALQSNMQALDIAHNVVFQHGLAARSVDAHTLARAILEPFGHDRISITGATGEIDRYAAINLSLILFELATNALKHGALSVPDGEARLSFADRGDALCFDWIERGGPPAVDAPPATGGGFGTKVLTRLLGTGGRPDAGRLFTKQGFEYRGAIGLIGPEVRAPKR